MSELLIIQVINSNLSAPHYSLRSIHLLVRIEKMEQSHPEPSNSEIDGVRANGNSPENQDEPSHPGPSNSRNDGVHADGPSAENHNEPSPQGQVIVDENDGANRNGLLASGNNENHDEAVVQNPNNDRQNRALNAIQNNTNDPNQAAEGAVNRRPKPAKLTGLRKYMENVTAGKKILDSYKTNGRLKHTTRSELVRLIGKREEDRAFKNIKAGEKLKKWDISNDRLDIYAKEIEYEFDGEYAATYFVAPEKVNGEYVKGSGKLTAHFGYKKGELKKKGHLKEDNLPTPRVIQVTATLEMKLAWLELNYEPEETLLEYFSDTEPYRRQLLIMNKIGVHEYLKKILGLRVTELAKKLIYNLFTDETDCTVSYLLALIIEPKRSGRKRKSKDNNSEQVAPVKRLSLLERRDSFIHVISTITDLESSINDLKKDLSAKKLSFQPTLVVIGPSPQCTILQSNSE
ncbi:hypothetical protein QAD02_013203 [Eretmocerus hayati]|uniref:Uncharacterized protein n=1 Tax=Eretmocerus hayati TaxID=131215 RepID=A0ACC2P2Y8_9HYME|nr:hypothetical protein QAD02_013203 [Eretmocerus hayati]